MSVSSARHRRVRLVVGPPGIGPGGIQEAFVEEVRRLKSADAMRPISVLVGSNYLRMHLSRLLAVRLGGHANITFMLLKDLARLIGTAPLLGRGLRRLPELGGEMLLREAVAAHSHGSYFQEIAAKDGFIEALAATVRDLKEAALDPAALRAAAATASSGTHRRGVGHRTSVSDRKLKDLADLFETYDDLLRDRRFYDEEDLMRSAVGQAAASAAEPPRASGSQTPAALVYGFYDVAWSQRLLIQEYLAFRNAFVFFPFDTTESSSSYEYVKPMLEWLASWIPERVDLPGVVAGAPGRLAPEISFLSAPGEAREAVEAVRWLLGQARERSLPFGELGLIYRSPDPYRRLLPEVMSQIGAVPHFPADGQPLVATRPARALLHLLRVREEGFTRRSVIEFLSLASGDVPAALWDRLSREAGVVKGIADWRRRLERLMASGRSRAAASGKVRDPGDLKAARELHRRVVDLHAALEELPSPATWRHLADATIGLMRRFLETDPCLEELESRISALGSLDEISSPAATAESTVRLEYFTALLERSLQRGISRTTRQGEFQRSGIFVGDVMDARLLSFDALAIVGLVEKSFPGPARQDPILLDEEREEINRVVGAARLPLKLRRLEEDRLLFRLACSSAAESLLLSYPRLEPATARPRIPSPFLLRTAEALEGRGIDYDALERLPRMTRIRLTDLAPSGASSALLAREFDLCVLRSAAKDPDARRRAASLLHSNPILHRALGAEEARWGESRFTSHDGVMLRPSVLEALRAVHSIRDVPVSASRIEEYATCPLAYFMKQVLCLEAVEEPEEEERMDPLRRGSLVHQILFEVFAALGERGLLPLTRERQDGALALLERVAAKCFAEAEVSGVTGYPMMWEIDKEQIREDLAAVILAEVAQGAAPEWVPAYFELRYGMEARGETGEDRASTAQPVRFGSGPDRAVLLKGKIDRVEISADGTSFRITDYKTGQLRRFKADSLLGGTSVQLPLYMLAAQALLAGRHPGIRAGEARYLSVDRRGGFGSVGFSAGALAERRGDLARVVETVVNSVARGIFFAYPDPNVCERCDYRLACGEGREERFARKEADATAADFLHMRKKIP